MKFTTKQIKAAQEALEFAMMILERNALGQYAIDMMPMAQAFAAARVGGEEIVEVSDFVPFAEEEKHG